MTELAKRLWTKENGKRDIGSGLLPGINRVGGNCLTRKIFSAQLIAGAEAMKTAVSYLEPMLMDAGAGRRCLPL